VELASQRTINQQLESDLQASERTIRELRSHNAELEGASQNKHRNLVVGLEAKLKLAEEQLEAERSEKSKFERLARRHEKRVNESVAQIEEERRNVERYKEETDRSNNKNRQLRRQIVELEEEAARERGKARALQRQLDDVSSSTPNL